MPFSTCDLTDEDVNSQDSALGVRLSVMLASVNPRQNLAKNVRMHRARLRLSQDELAKLAGSKRNQISLIETEQANPTLDGIQKLADALGVSVCDLFLDSF